MPDLATLQGIEGAAVGAAPKTKVVLVGLYLSGIYPSGDDDVVSRLLATSFLKAAALGVPEITEKFDIDILDIPVTTSPGEIADKIAALDPMLVGYSSYIWNYMQVNASMALVKRRIPNARILLGGPMVSYTSEDFLRRNSAADIVIRGSGEASFNGLLLSGFGDEALSRIPNVTFRGVAGDIRRSDSDAKSPVEIVRSVYASGIHDLDDGRRHTVFLETFRGCPFSCGYCVWGAPDQNVHKMSMENVLADVEAIYNNPNVEVVFVTDACIFYTRKRAKVIIDKIAECKRRIPTVLTLDVHVLDEEMIEYLDKLDLHGRHYHFGLQSTNPEALRLLRRPGGGQAGKYVDKISLLRRVKPDAKISFDVIYGLPGDNLTGFRDTIDFALDLGADKLHFSPLLLLPGTQFFNEREKLGIVADEDPPYMVSANRTFSADQMLCAVDLVLWVNLVMYFPALLEAVREICRHLGKPSFVASVEDFARRVKSRTDPMAGVVHVFSIEHNNYIRRRMMNHMTRPENALILFQEMRGLLADFGIAADGDELAQGILFYQELAEPDMSVDVAATRLGWGADRVRAVLSSWVPSGSELAPEIRTAG